MRRDCWLSEQAARKISAMGRKFTFREILENAARSIPHLWTADDELNLSAVARYYKEKHHPITQPTLQRLCSEEHGKPSDRTVEATYHVFKVPRQLLRGEPVRPEMEDLLAEHRLSTLLLAKKIESLPKAFRDGLYAQVEAFLDQREQIGKSTNVTPIDRDRPNR